VKLKECLEKLSSANTHKRRGVNRQIVKAVRGESAKQAIGVLYPGCEIYGFTKGQFCLIDILEHCLEQTGPADVVICTWSAASGDIRAANRLLREKRIKSLRFVVDYSFKSRKPEFCAELLTTFGADCIRVSSIHAKFCTVKSDTYSLVIRTSMNLNYNPRFENFEISDDVGMFDFMSEIVEELWRTQETYAGFDARPSDNIRSFQAMFATGALEPARASDLVKGRI
jgi:hypothetical protein